MASGLAAIEEKAKPNGKDHAEPEITLSAEQEATLKKISDKKHRERLRGRMIEAKRRELAKKNEVTAKVEEAKSDGAKTSEDKPTSVVTNVTPAGHSVEVTQPAMVFNMPAPHVNVNNGALSFSYYINRAGTWLQAFVIGAAAWALIGDGVLRFFGH